MFELNGSVPDQTPPRLVKRDGQITLRRFIVSAVAFATASFVWQRSNGDQAITALVFLLTLFTIDVRLVDQDHQK